MVDQTPSNLLSGIPFSVYESRVSETGVIASIKGRMIDEKSWEKMDDRTRLQLLSDIDLVSDYETFDQEKKTQNETLTESKIT